jgi:Co/Zn/Cd efflux system component
MDHQMVHEVRSMVARLPGADGITITDLHVWRVGRHQFACILRLATTDAGLTSLAVRSHLAHYPAMVHSTVEINLDRKA